jgi:hypothetical protein
VGSRAGLDVVARRKYSFLALLRNPSHPACSLVTMVTELLWLPDLVSSVNFSEGYQISFIDIKLACVKFFHT